MDAVDAMHMLASGLQMPDGSSTDDSSMRLSMEILKHSKTFADCGG